MPNGAKERLCRREKDEVLAGLRLRGRPLLAFEETRVPSASGGPGPRNRKEVVSSGRKRDERQSEYRGADLAGCLAIWPDLRADEKTAGRSRRRRKPRRRAEAEQAKKKEAEEGQAGEDQALPAQPRRHRRRRIGPGQGRPQHDRGQAGALPHEHRRDPGRRPERQAGVDVQRIQEVGTAMDDDSIKIRGMGARRIKVLRNGRPLNSSGVGRRLLHRLDHDPARGADRIEVIKGVGDPRYGNVIGGVVNLVPRCRRDGPRPKSRRPTPATPRRPSTFSTATSPGPSNIRCRPGAIPKATATCATAAAWPNADVHLGYDFALQGPADGRLACADVKKNFAVSNRASKILDNPALRHARSTRTFPAADGEIMYGGMGRQPPSRAATGSRTNGLPTSATSRRSARRGFSTARCWLNHGDREAYNTRASAQPGLPQDVLRRSVLRAFGELPATFWAPRP